MQEKKQEEKQEEKKKRYGRVLKVSQESYTYLRKKKKKGEGFDATIRRIFGLKDKKGNPQPLKKYWLLERPEPTIFATQSEARGEAMIRAAMDGKRKAEKPKRMREDR